MFNSDWFNNLTKPPFTPPSQIFTPAWAVLYTTMVISFVIYRFTSGENKFWGYTFFFIQLVLNLLWSPVFFGLQLIGYALILILMLDITVFLTIIEFHKTSKTAAYLLIPYFLWLIYATYLNFGYFILNQ